MADVHDYLDAARATDAALDALHSYGALIEGGTVSDDTNLDVAMAVLLGSRAVALALREAAVRADYVARDRR